MYYLIYEYVYSTSDGNNCSTTRVSIRVNFICTLSIIPLSLFSSYYPFLFDFEFFLIIFFVKFYLVWLLLLFTFSEVAEYPNLTYY